MQKVEEDPTWYDKPYSLQQADMYAMAAEKQMEIKSGIVPLMDDVKDTSKDTSEMTPDQLGKLPLAIQQLSNAADKASKLGNTKLYNVINAKIDSLIKEI